MIALPFKLNRNYYLVDKKPNYLIGFHKNKNTQTNLKLCTPLVYKKERGVLPIN
jgi:hypothetical protein